MTACRLLPATPIPVLVSVMLRRLLLALCFALPCASVLAAASAPNDTGPDAPPGKVFVYKHSDGKAQELEVYFPDNWNPVGKKVPGVILFHGGGWTGGSLSQFRLACRYLASRGLVTATANYRMLNRAEVKARKNGESHKRVCITDAKSAIRWMKQHASELGIDPSRIITGGGSAGGHIAVLATTNPGLDDPTDPKGFDTSVVAYLLFNPAFSPDDAKDAEIDVLRHVRANIAPAIAFFGTKDTWKPGWDAVATRLGNLGAKQVEVWLAEGMPHGFFNKQPWQNVTLAEADRFLVRQGLLSGEPTLPATEGNFRLVRSP